MKYEKCETVRKFFQAAENILLKLFEPLKFAERKPIY